MTHQLRGSWPQVLTYGDPRGHRGLEAVAADRLSRDVRPAPDDVLVTSGSQQAVELVARPGDRVAAENHGYPQARQLFATQRAQPVCVPVDADGLVVDEIRITAAPFT